MFAQDCDLIAGVYKYIRPLGHGAFGEVLVAQDIRSEDELAVKQLYLPEPGAPLPTSVAREVSALQQLQHPNVVALRDVVVSGCCVYICQELCCSDLAAELAAADQQLAPQRTCTIMHQLLSALAACHKAGIMHRDVKPSNMLVTTSGDMKLADFGLAARFEWATNAEMQQPLLEAAAGHARCAGQLGSSSAMEAPESDNSTTGTVLCAAQHVMQQQQQQQDLQPCQQHPCHTAAQGTRWYRAPELLYGSRKYGPAVDVWAAGMVFAELLGLTPFIPGQSDIDQLARMQHTLGSITPQDWPAVEQLPDWHKISFAHSAGQPLAVLLPDAPPAALDLLQQLIVYDPQRRMTAAAALQHGYFTKVAALHSTALHTTRCT